MKVYNGSTEIYRHAPPMNPRPRKGNPTWNDPSLAFARFIFAKEMHVHTIVWTLKLRLFTHVVFNYQAAVMTPLCSSIQLRLVTCRTLSGEVGNLKTLKLERYIYTIPKHVFHKRKQVTNMRHCQNSSRQTTESPIWWLESAPNTV